MRFNKRIKIGSKGMNTECKFVLQTKKESTAIILIALKPRKTVLNMG